MKKVFESVNNNNKNNNNVASDVPIVTVSHNDDLYYNNNYGSEEEADADDVLPLPASKYRYSKWSQMEETEITASMLKTPRVRKAPRGFQVDTVEMLQEQERIMLQDDDDDDVIDVHNTNKRGWWRKKKKRRYQNKLENWERCECVNLSYQDLGHPYQMKEFLKVLRRLIRCEYIELMDNGLSDLSTVYFSKCRHLFLQRNHLSDLKKLPRFGRIEHISLQQNNIGSLKGLEVLAKATTLKSLILKENPVALQPGYRTQVFRLLPHLVLLDGLPRFDTDLDMNDDESRSCSIF